MGSFVEKAEHGYRYYFDTDDENATIEEFTKRSATETEVPSELGGKPVASLDVISFIRNESLTTVKIPASLIEINEHDQAGYTSWPVSLERFEVDAASKHFKDVDGVLFDKSGEMLLAFPTAKRGDYTVPDGVRNAHLCSFHSDKNRIDALRLPATFTRESISALPYTVTEYIVHPDNPFIASRDGVIYDKGFTVLLKCPSRRKGDLTVPEGVVGAAEDAFRHIAYFQAPYIDTLHLPASFALPENEALTYAAKRFDVASGHPSLRSIEGFLIDFGGKLLAPHGPWGHARVIQKGKRVTRLLATPEERAVAIPEGVKAIADKHFAGSILKSVSIPPSVESLGKGVFSGCLWMTDAAVNGSFRELPAATFEECRSLASVSLPDGLETVGAGAFKDCGSLAEVDLPPRVRTIGDSAFAGCKSLTCIALPDDTAFLGVDAFYQCSSLTDVTLSRSLRKVMAGAFSDCAKLASVNLPDTIEQVSPYAFERTPLARSGDLEARGPAVPSGMTISCPKCKQDISHVIWRDFAWCGGTVFTIVEPAAIKSKSSVDISTVLQTAAEDHSVAASDINLFSEGSECDADTLDCKAVGFSPHLDCKANRAGAICPRCYQLLNMKPRG